MNGFIHGLIIATTISIPIIIQRHLAALRGLSKNSNFIATPSDKIGGVVIIDSTQFYIKITEL